MSWEIAAALAAADFIGNEITNASNASQAVDNRNFQSFMSGSAHQREVADLRAAGLNPILSSRYGGSSTPSGAQAVMTNSMGSAARTYSDNYRARLEGERNPSVIQQNESSAKRMDAAANLDYEQARVADATVKKIGLEGENLDAQTKRIIYEVRAVLPSIEELNRASAFERREMGNRIIAEVSKLLPSQVDLNRSSAERNRVDYKLLMPASARLHNLQGSHVASETFKLKHQLEAVLIDEQIDTSAWGIFWKAISRAVSGTVGSIFK